MIIWTLSNCNADWWMEKILFNAIIFLAKCHTSFWPLPSVKSFLFVCFFLYFNLLWNYLAIITINIILFIWSNLIYFQTVTYRIKEFYFNIRIIWNLLWDHYQPTCIWHIYITHLSTFIADYWTSCLPKILYCKNLFIIHP